MSELTTLRSAKATDFEYVDVLGHGCAGVVLRARCKLGGLTKSYAVKIIYSYLSVTKDLIEKQRVEFELLESLSSPHVVKCWCHFEDALPASVKPLIPAETWDLMCERGAAPQTLFAVFDLYPQTLRTFRLQWGDVMPRLPFTNLAVAILNAFVFLEESNVLHRDVKDDNVMVVVEGDTTGIRLCDFGDAVRVISRDARFVAMNDPPTGNQAHQAPELRNIFGTFVRGTDIVVDYSGQAVFEVGVLLCEVLTLRHPITGYAAAGRHLEYSRSNCCEFPPSITAQLREEGYSDGFLALIRSMVAYDPARRPALKAARAELIKLLSSPEETHTAVRRPMDTSPVLPPPTRWTCIACNGVNSGDSTRCASCSIDRSAPAITPWHCRSCSFRNTFYVRMCGKCGASAAEETGLDGRPLPAYAVTTRAPLTVTTRSPATPVMTSSITPGWRCACGCATNESFRRTCKQCFAGKV